MDAKIRSHHLISEISKFYAPRLTIAAHVDDLTDELKSVFGYMSVVSRLCGLVVRVLGYRSGGPDSILGTAKKKSSGSGTGSTQPREFN
jgi:hypothetical protein